MAIAKQQLTFDVLLNPSVVEIDELRLSAQALQILRLFRILERMNVIVTTNELSQIAHQYNARLNEVRHALVKVGLMIDETGGRGGNNYYRVVPLDKSTFWASVQKKDEVGKWL